jgi:hypothetical protein
MVNKFNQRRVPTNPPFLFDTNLVSRWALLALAGASPQFSGFATGGQPGLAPNGTHFDCGSSDSLGFSGFLRF